MRPNHQPTNTASNHNGQPTMRGGLSLLTITGLAMLALYVAFYVLMLSRSLWERPTLIQDRWKTVFRPIRDFFPHDWVTAKRMTELGLLNDFFYLALIALLFGLYFCLISRLWRGGLFTEKRGGQAFRRILLLTFLFLAVLFVVHGTLSSDLYSYISYGRIVGVYGGNPFMDVPSEYAWSDKANWLQWVYWKDTPSIYGPAWLMLAGLVARIAQAIDGDIVTYLLGNKLVASLAHLVNIWLIWRVAGLAFARFGAAKGRLSRSGASEEGKLLGARLAVTATYAWNPLMVIEFGASGHNDIFMLTALLAALWLLLAGKWRLASFALAMAFLVKLIAVLFLPAFLWLLFWEGAGERPGWTRRKLLTGLGRALQASFVFGATVVVGYLPYWAGPQVIKAVTGGPPATLFVNSLGAVLRDEGAEGLSKLAHALHLQPYLFWEPQAIGNRLDWPARFGPLLITAAIAFLQTLSTRSFPTMLRAWGWTFFAYLTLASVWYWPWYACWLIVPISLLGPSRLFRAAQILCASSMALYAIAPTMAAPLTELPRFSGLIIMAPPLLYLFGSWAREAWGHRVARDGNAKTQSLPSSEAKGRQERAKINDCLEGV